MGAVGVVDTRITFKLDHRTLTLEYRKLPFSAWAELKRTLGWTQTTLIDALGDLDVEAVAAVIWLERKQRERQLRFPEVVAELERTPDAEFEIADIRVRGVSVMLFAGDDQKTEVPGEEAEDPTVGS